MVIGLALDYLEAYCMSDFSEENLLSAIEQTQVSLHTAGNKLIPIGCNGL